MDLIQDQFMTTKSSSASIMSRSWRNDQLQGKHAALSAARFCLYLY